MSATGIITSDDYCSSSSSYLNLPKFNIASVLVHFHSDFSLLVPLSSSSTRGTQPPNTYILLLTSVAEWRDRGKGAAPPTVGLSHVIEPEGGEKSQALV